MQHLWKTLNHLKKTLAGKSGKTNEGYFKEYLVAKVVKQMRAT